MVGRFLSDSQFGFRKRLRTVDSVFVLHNLIQSFINNKMRLPCALTDLKKAFDSVYRNVLWFKLVRMGFDGKILVMFRSMYAVVKSCVKRCNSLSDFFNISVGLRQALFALFLEDLELFLQNRTDCGIEIADLCLIILLFAADMVIIGHSNLDLQHNLNRLHEYCNLWGLEVNIAKRFYNNILNDLKLTQNYLYNCSMPSWIHFKLWLSYLGVFQIERHRTTPP